MHKHRKKISKWLWITIGVLVLIAGFLGWYYVFLTSMSWLHSIESSPITTDSTTENWKTYKNTNNHYLIKYPADWHLYSYSDAIYIQKKRQDDPCVKDCAPGPYASALKIGVKTINPNKTIKEVVSDYIKSLNFTESSSDYFVKTPINIGDKQGMKLVSTCDGLGCGAPIWLAANNNYSYIFDSQLGYDKVFDQIVSTFKFIK